MKVIFLDVDGVLNSENDLLELPKEETVNPGREIFDRPLALLKELVDATNAKIVISSSWRVGCAKCGRESFYGKELYEMLKKRLADFDMAAIDVTPVINKPTVKRGDEIRKWLNTTEYDIESFVILDDESDMCEYTSTNLVQTSMETGLQEEHVEIAKAILNAVDVTQDDVIEALRKTWQKCPELRFGQLIVNVLGVDPFYVPDKGVIQKMKSFVRE